MTTQPRVSVLTPVYNGARFVQQTLVSVLNQTYTDFEYVIIDDGSTDGTLAILESYAAQDSRIRLHSRPNKGMTATLNELLDMARGEYIALQDSDDIALPNRLADQVAYLDVNKNVVCISGAHELMDAEGRYLTRLDLPLEDDAIQSLLIAGHSSICHACSMSRRDAMFAVGKYDETMRFAHDLDMWIKLGEVGKLANLREPLLRYRLHNASISESRGQEQRDEAHLACKNAWERRGVIGRFEATELWRPGPDIESQHHFLLKYGWWAFNSRQRETAAHYGVAAVRKKPRSRESWNLLLCSLLKPLPESETVPTPLPRQ